MIRAVIFDMDGLLTDSEIVGLRVIKDCGKLQGYELDEAVVLQTIGSTNTACIETYRRHYPGMNGERLFADFHRAMLDLAREGGIPLKKGARELLDTLRARGIPTAVASSSAQEVIELYLGKAGVLSCFDALVSGMGGIASKPAPDIFLKAAQALNTPPEECLVLEDSVNGIKAGRAAGMTVCMVPDLFPFTDALAPYCDAVKPDLAAVIPLLDA